MRIIRFDDGMTMSGLKYLAFDTDRHGNLRCYVRRHGRKIRIRDLSTIERFPVQYRAALDAPSVGPAAQPGVATPGSLRWLIER